MGVDDDLPPQSTSTEADVDAALAVARAAWPGLSLSWSDFAEAVRHRTVPLAQTPPEIVADLFLARACAKNVPGALLFKMFGACTYFCFMSSDAQNQPSG